MSLSSAQVTDFALQMRAEVMVNGARIIVNNLVKETNYSPEQLLDYALLAAATDSPFTQVLACLQDCNTPDSAKGRLLMQAAERVLRETGDTNGPKYKS